MPIKKQRILIKPKKHKLPISVNILEEETFSDVIYDSDKDNTKDKQKKATTAAGQAAASKTNNTKWIWK